MVGVRGAAGSNRIRQLPPLTGCGRTHARTRTTKVEVGMPRRGLLRALRAGGLWNYNILHDIVHRGASTKGGG